jgi:hypothetical protein
MSCRLGSERSVTLSVIHDDDRRWIVVRATGCVAIDEMLNLIRTVRAQVAHRMTPMVFDARGATTTATEDDIRQAVDAVRRANAHGLRGHVALVADDDTFYSRLLCYETECAAIGVRVIRAFRQLSDAERWLQIVSAARNFR